MNKPLEWAVGFFFGNAELSLELWNIISGISNKGYEILKALQAHKPRLPIESVPEFLITLLVTRGLASV